MSEKLSSGGEHKTGNVDLSVESRKNLERIQKIAKNEQNYHEEVIEELETAVEAEAISGKEITVGENAEDNSQITPIGEQQELKNTAFKQTMTKVRRKLTKPQKALSKIIHQPVVQKMSDISAKTVARPSGFLMGGLCALVGSGILFFSARYYGFTYNYNIFVILFVGGYLCGVVGELIFKIFAHKQ